MPSRCPKYSSVCAGSPAVRTRRTAREFSSRVSPTARAAPRFRWSTAPQSSARLPDTFVKYARIRSRGSGFSLRFEAPSGSMERARSAPTRISFSSSAKRTTTKTSQTPRSRPACEALTASAPVCGVRSWETTSKSTVSSALRRRARTPRPSGMLPSPPESRTVAATLIELLCTCTSSRRARSLSFPIFHSHCLLRGRADVFVIPRVHAAGWPLTGHPHRSPSVREPGIRPADQGGRSSVRTVSLLLADQEALGLLPLHVDSHAGCRRRLSQLRHGGGRDATGLVLHRDLQLFRCSKLAQA